MYLLLIYIYRYFHNLQLLHVNIIFCNGYIKLFLDYEDQVQSGPQFGSYFHFGFGYY